ncbi:MAG: hypothetical protein ACJAVR_003215 [Paracoccaceae bacterium]|jgi:hypothetical protein
MIYPRGAEVSGKVAGWALAADEAKPIRAPTGVSPAPYPENSQSADGGWVDESADLTPAQVQEIRNSLNKSRFAVLHDAVRQDRFVRQLNDALNVWHSSRTDPPPDPQGAFARVQAVGAALNKAKSAFAGLREGERDLFAMLQCDISAIEARLTDVAEKSERVASSLKLSLGQKFDAPPGRWAMYLAWRSASAYREAFGKAPSASPGSVFFNLVNLVLHLVDLGEADENGNGAIGRDALKAILK